MHRDSNPSLHITKTTQQGSWRSEEHRNRFNACLFTHKTLTWGLEQESKALGNPLTIRGRFPSSTILIESHKKWLEEEKKNIWSSAR